MRKGLTFNLADREKHMDSLKQLYGDSNAAKEEDRQEANPKPKDPNDYPKRASGV